MTSGIYTRPSVWLAVMASVSVIASAGCTERATDRAKEYVRLLRKARLADLKVDTVMMPEEVGISVALSMVEAKVLPGMPLLLRARIQNNSALTHQVVGLDAGKNGLWLPDLIADVDFVSVGVFHVESRTFSVATIGDRTAQSPLNVEHNDVSGDLGLRRNLAPGQWVLGDFDLSPLYSLKEDSGSVREGLWSYDLGGYQVFLLWVGRIPGSDVALVAETSFDFVEPNGIDALAWAEISRIRPGWWGDEVTTLSPLLSEWSPELEQVALTYPGSAYAKYIHYLKPWTLEQRGGREKREGTYAAAASAYLDFVSRYPNWALADEALLGYARCLYYQACYEDSAHASDLLRRARHVAETLPARYPDTNCGPASQFLLRWRIEDKMADLGISK